MWSGSTTLSSFYAAFRCAPAADGRVRVPGFDGNYGTAPGPETERMKMIEGDGSAYNSTTRRHAGR